MACLDDEWPMDAALGLGGAMASEQLLSIMPVDLCVVVWCGVGGALEWDALLASGTSRS